MARRYSDEQRLNALAALAGNEGNVSRTAKQLGIPMKTLHCWARGERHPEAAQAGERTKQEMAKALEAIAWQLLDAMGDKKRIKEATLVQVATAMAIAIDKARILQSQPTSITASAMVEMTDQELQAIIAAGSNAHH
jgi:transposase-like protein